MNKLDELKQIVATQKTIRTSRLGPILKEIETMYIQQGNKIKRQNKAYGELNESYKKLRRKVK